MDTPKPLSKDDRNTQAGIIVTTILATVLADIVVALRMITRKWIVKSIGWDDWTILAALVRMALQYTRKVLIVCCSLEKQLERD